MFWDLDGGHDENGGCGRDDVTVSLPDESTKFLAGIRTLDYRILLNKIRPF